MGETPANFNIETAAEDFAAQGRTIDIENSIQGGLARRRMRLIVNGWTFSAIWGGTAYCTAARGGGFPGNPSPISPDAEVAVWAEGSAKFMEIDGDSVAGWVSPANFIAAVEAAERDDQDGIRAALVRRDDDAA